MTTSTPAGTRTGPIDLARLAGTRLQKVPWTHGVLADTFTTPTAVTELTRTFPTTRFTQVQYADERKQFINEVRNDVHSPDLTDIWRDLLGQITSAAYRQVMATVTSIDLDQALVRPAFWRYGPDCWLSPHPDDDSKLLTHVLYFNADWPRDIGGHLLITRSADIADVQRRVTPDAGTSVIIVRSDHSWHAVEPVTAGNRTRLSLTVAFHRPDADVSHYGY